MIKLISKQLEVFDSSIWLSIPTGYIVRRFICENFNQTDSELFSNSMMRDVSMNE